VSAYWIRDADRYSVVKEYSTTKRRKRIVDYETLSKGFLAIFASLREAKLVSLSLGYLALTARNPK
jgi:hypothetical protein